MTAIDRIIQREPNPFDTETFWSGNFWQEVQNPDLTVDSIHQDALDEIEAVLDRVADDRRSRTILLEGETGSGKTYLLGRLKRSIQTGNADSASPRAFFVYVEPFTASDYIWRHILRYTVDSLLEKPEGQDKSQILLWLEDLSDVQQGGFIDWLRGGVRQIFVRKLLEAYPSGIYNAQEFFGALYHLTNPELYPIACEWLRGDDLDEDSLRKLGVQSTIDTEDAAQKTLANFGRIADATQPIVLCFDQLDNIARNSDGSLDLQSLFRVNAMLHTQKVKNFLFVISIITDTWRQNQARIPATDRDRIDTTIRLKQITLDQAEALWASRLYLLHRQTYPQPESPIYPLARQYLDDKFPGGKTRPRNTLILGRRLYQESKLDRLQSGIVRNGGTEFSHNGSSPSLPPKVPTDATSDPAAAFKLVWLKKFKQTEERVNRLRQYAAPELMQMLAEALSVLKVEDVRSRLLPSRTYASYSLSYRAPGTPDRVGVVWSEDANMVKFFNLLKACREALDRKLCHTLQLVRAEGVGSPSNRGYQLYTEIFSDDRNNHFMSDLVSVRYLSTYHTLVNDALSGELVVGEETPDLDRLESLTRQTEVLTDCPLLQQLGFFETTVAREEAEASLQAIEDFIINRVVNQQCMAIEQLIEEAIAQFGGVSKQQVHQLIETLSLSDRPVRILDPDLPLEEQLVIAQT
ncbi:ATP-binding protein [Baaleninema simplex]|uniref:ATP-binding protein n=1 Tax=Baaleninema simplex TaxID=2862350 RepID=UPI000349F931|nr:ATP-binding protein [Baaleninema simplex]